MRGSGSAEVVAIAGCFDLLFLVVSELPATVRELHPERPAPVERRDRLRPIAELAGAHGQTGVADHLGEGAVVGHNRG